MPIISSALAWASCSCTSHISRSPSNSSSSSSSSSSSAGAPGPPPPSSSSSAHPSGGWSALLRSSILFSRSARSLCCSCFSRVNLATFSARSVAASAGPSRMYASLVDASSVPILSLIERNLSTSTRAARSASSLPACTPPAPSPRNTWSASAL